MGLKKSVMCHVLPVMFHVSCVIHNMSAASVTCNPKVFKNPKMFQTSNTKNGFLSFAILLFTKSLPSSEQKSPVYAVLGPTGGDNQTNTQACRHCNLLTEFTWRLIHKN